MPRKADGPRQKSETALLSPKQKLAEQSAFLISVFESLNHPFYVIDAEDYTIQLANSAARLGTLSGLETCYELTHRRSHPCADPHAPCPLEEVKRTRKPAVVEHVHYLSDGTARIVQVRAYPILNEAGEVAQMVEFIADITAPKRLETELRQLNDRLERQVEQRTAELQETHALLQEEIAARRDKEQALRTILSGQADLSPQIAGSEHLCHSAPIKASDPKKGLTRRELEVLQLLAEGKTLKETAAALNVTTKTVEAHRWRVRKKLSLSSAAELTRYAIRTGLVSP